MKSGASDPFADDDAEDEAESPPEANDAAATPESDADEAMSDSSGTGASTGDVRDAETPDAATRDTATRDDAARGSEATNSEADAPSSDGDEGDGGLSRDELPFILRREKVKDERPEVHQLFVQRETHEEAVDAERTLEKRLGEGLSRTDAREAIYLAGMAHLDDAEEILREWGYDL
ncbi:hypothetical protein [Halopelagius longus]|uniref:Uncharacterized protein n=1 Tax=Halopelagius longus TaxID=1236180 RepID=A0A1H1G7N0_9EURY|nr:hypothetical protein [Halopelagius longus]RDI69789.1 hypothetical protein DWB78_16695 [Halopelagius longus]SDR09274.1 hypothetical protein SAMN05216278_3577 [Halopelagius longus]